MQQQEIHDFLITFFEANDCEVLENAPSHITVQLTIEMDKELMNRPFYWHYLEKTGGIPNPAQITFIIDPVQAPPNMKGERIHFGSPRLHQIIESTKRLAGYTRLFEDTLPSNGGHKPLFPWLTLNVKISYQCDRKKDIFMSVGLNLISGEIMEGFHNRVLPIKVTPKIPDYSFTLSPLIMPKSGLARLDTYIRTSFENDDHSWAEEAMERWQNDLNLLEHFYKDMEEKSESYFTEKQALQAQYEPNILISIINGGLFYLSDRALG
ncbi:YqhG family protein [Peribacillus sp. NPDC060186]